MLLQGKYFFFATLKTIGPVRSLLMLMCIYGTYNHSNKELQVAVANILGLKNLASVIIVLCKSNINYAVGIFKFVRETFAPILIHLRIEWHHICHVSILLYVWYVLRVSVRLNVAK